MTKYIPNLQCNESTIVCDSCPMARQTRLPFPMSSTQSIEKSQLIHADIWGPYNAPIFSGAKCFLITIDDFPDLPGPFL